jgi:hypothetical protein
MGGREKSGTGQAITGLRGPGKICHVTASWLKQPQEPKVFLLLFRKTKEDSSFSFEEKNQKPFSFRRWFNCNQKPLTRSG